MPVSNNPSAPPFPLLMTRPRAASAAFLAKLPSDLADRLSPTISPLLEIVATGAEAEMGPDDAAIFTSANGARFGPEGAGRRAYCVGEVTTDAARGCEWNSRMCGETAAELTTRLVQNPPKQRLFHLSGTHIRGDIAGELDAAGCNATRIAVYDQRLCARTEEARALLAGDRPVFVPLFSPRTAQHFFNLAHDKQAVVPLVLGENVASCVPDDLRRVTVIASAPNADAMITALEQSVQRRAAG